ncbi:LPXTG cell wall anchor domain-containing protein [Micromonospora sp. WMMD1120]|uniref:LPXTG cell wall anchor domain-containing protein n=1 Tax=Micromonospora sp. WMMD1120 TaxID=3016106 RepID=UPI00241750F7|nr:LPXTG cell wall anchor domain-containing protein [Micromonospora sp. WMMD1120]MDG4807390.1 LPXTG cell wall anchor domain-containing protein [Micromonospora sp. WMMD1120]
MRWKFPAGALIALALFIPAAPAAAQAAAPGLDAACQTVERKVYTDIRELVTIDLDTASTTELRVLTSQILHRANVESLPVLPDVIQKELDGTPEELREFLKSDMEKAWAVALRVSVVRTLTDAGPHVEEAAQKVLGTSSVDTYLAYLNNGLYEARALDCKSQPTPTPSATATATPSATPTVAPTATPSASLGAAGGNGGGLPVTGANTLTVAGIGAALLLLGGVGYVIGRRRRSRFVA